MSDLVPIETAEVVRPVRHTLYCAVAACHDGHGGRIRLRQVSMSRGTVASWVLTCPSCGHMYRSAAPQDHITYEAV